jgi:hypothetical protein
MSGLQTDLLTGLAALIQGRNLGVYAPGSAYDPLDSRAAITLYKVPQEPDRIICLSAYPVDDALGAPNSTIGVQIITRWNGTDPRPVDDLDDAIFGVLQQYHGTLSTGVRVAHIWRVSGTPLGPDEGGRHSKSSNYYVSAFWPTSNRV